jgi:hypothetical protein
MKRVDVQQRQPAELVVPFAAFIELPVVGKIRGVGERDADVGDALLKVVQVGDRRAARARDLDRDVPDAGICRLDERIGDRKGRHPQFARRRR